MTQEHIMKRRMHIAIIFAIVATIGMIVFIALYIDEMRRVQNTYREQYIACLGHTSKSLDSYINADADFEFRYRNIINDMSSANSFGFLLDKLTQQQKVTVNEVNTILIKYPQQMNDKKKLAELKQALDDIAANLDKGYEEAQKIVSSIDKLGK